MQSTKNQEADRKEQRLTTDPGIPILQDYRHICGILHITFGLIDVVLWLILICLPMEYRTKEIPFESFWWGAMIATFALCAGFSGLQGKNKKYLLFVYAVTSGVTLLSCICGIVWCLWQIPILVHYLKFTDIEGYRYAWAHIIVTGILLMTFCLQAMTAEFGAIIPYVKLCCEEIPGENDSVRDIPLREIKTKDDATEYQTNQYSRQIVTESSEVYYAKNFPTSSSNYSYPRSESDRFHSQSQRSEDTVDSDRSTSNLSVNFEAFDSNDGSWHAIHHVYNKGAAMDKNSHVSSMEERTQIDHTYCDERIYHTVH